ncbi:hypothetical protein [Chitinasiproducens palmae]|uniref:Uncharacterized protein n=1 Tax=Chitinasiproducens palmae TaxID=1770053 RepID=A0A1H2PRZ8_9BURK|nr:hypothetical protein [Chitinasiproducens palmae]SDV48912.1 hypothetical protein SAMN05216551_106162 [Chitinasiproducens palmae]
MSGPKVVRIVTREEVLADCHRMLRRLDRTIAAWTKEGQGLGQLADGEIAATQARRRALATLLATDATIRALRDAQRELSDETAFLGADLERRRTLAVDHAERVQRRRRQARSSAQTLLHTFASRRLEVPAALVERIAAIAEGQAGHDDAVQTDAVLAQGFAQLSPPADASLSAGSSEPSAAQRELAAQLTDGQMSVTFESWQAAHLALSREPAFERLDRQIAEADVFLPAAETAGFADRLRDIEAHPTGAHRNLLLDSLTLDLSDAVAGARAHRSAIDELEELAAEVRARASDDTGPLLARLDALGGAVTMDTIEELIEHCRAALARVQQREAAQARRQAVLEGMARLGYDVREGMSTAWARDGRIVVGKASLPGYAIEVGGQTQTSRLQVRAVALSAERDLARDKDVETLWCSDFAQLQAELAQHGDDLLIERALGIGEVPLKVADAAEAAIATTSKARTLR